MRFLIKATLPVESGNALVRDPNMQSRMEQVMGDLRPEAAYFTIDSRQRTVYFVVNVEGTEDSGAAVALVECPRHGHSGLHARGNGAGDACSRGHS